MISIWRREREQRRQAVTVRAEGQGDGTYQRTKVRAGRGDNKKDRLALKRKDDCPKSDGKSAGMVSNYRKGCVDSDF